MVGCNKNFHNFNFLKLGEKLADKRDLVRVYYYNAPLDYKNNPSAWEAQINNILGPDFPYFACVGNHDKRKWNGENGYQQFLKSRLNRLGITWDGDLGVKSSVQYKGIFIIQVAPGDVGFYHAAYIREQLAEDKSIWMICCWHRDMHLMQVASKNDDTGWGVYDEARKGGAIIATAHDHSYGRTYLMSNFAKQEVTAYTGSLIITEGQTFAFFSGLGGESINTQKLKAPLWARLYTKTQGATYGVLFGIFNVNGIPNKATFYFKNINNEIIDRFDVISYVHIK